MCAIEFDEYCSIWREAERKARKQHKCNSCWCRIEIGELYIEHFDIFQGQTNREKCCMPCDVDRQEFSKAHSVMLGPMSWPEFLWECLAEGDDEDAQKWKSAADRLRERREMAKESAA